MKHSLHTRFDQDTLTSHVVIVRRYEQGEFPYGAPNVLQWAGREFGWRDTRGWILEPKRYSSKRVAHDALTRIKAHERELGLTGRYYHV